MEVVEYKVGHNLLKITDSDRVMFNNAVYVLYTQNVGTGWDKHSPLVAKPKARKLINLDILIPVEKYVTTISGIKSEYENYKFDLEKLEQFVKGELK